MIYSVGCEYGIRALVRLATLQATGRYSLLREIVEPEGLPSHFVGKVLQSLVHAGIVSSAKGRGGGFALKKPADEIRLRDIVNAIDGPERIGRCILGFRVCDDYQNCPQHDQWAGIRLKIDELLDNTTVAHMVMEAGREHRLGRPARRA